MRFLYLLILLCYGTSVCAACIRTISLSPTVDAKAIAAGYTAASWSGSTDTADGPMGIQNTISISGSSSIQPSGTLLASSTKSFLTGGYNGGYSANQVLFRCALSDANSLYEYYATNGDSPYAGMYLASEVNDAYYSFVRNIAFRLTNVRTGEYFSRYWKRRALDTEDLFNDGTYIYVPAKAFSGITMELFKINSTTYYANAATRYKYAWSQPFGYTAFQGGGLSSALSVGADSASQYGGWYAYWPGAWGLFNSSVTFVRGAICTLSDYPSYVLFPTTTIVALDAGNTSQKNFNISLTCESNAKSGTASSNSTPELAIGFLVNNATAVASARKLGLTSGSTGLTMLLDSKYGSPSQASGVGIKIYSSKTGSAINLLSTSYTAGAGANYTGNANGWYGFTTLTSNIGANIDNNTLYSGSFIASLEKISGQTVTPGEVNAQLQVLVSLQ